MEREDKSSNCHKLLPVTTGPLLVAPSTSTTMKIEYMGCLTGNVSQTRITLYPRCTEVQLVQEYVNVSADEEITSEA